MKRLVAVLAAVSMTACGLIKVNVNGKTVALGAPAPAAPAAAPSAAASSGAAATSSTSAAEAKVTPVTNRQVESLTLDASLNEIPRIIAAPGVLLDTSFSKKISNKGWPDCGSSMPSTPIAAFEVKEAVRVGTVISVVGGGNDGFVLLRQDSTYWTSCTNYAGQVPTMGSPKEGWAPGRYEVYPLSRYSGKDARNYQVEFYNPDKPAVWSASVQKLSLAKKLDAPLFVEVTTKPGRVVLREDFAGQACKRTPLPVEPDLSITLERPIPGLIVRPLYTRQQLAIRVQTPDTDKGRGRKFCTGYRREVVANGYSPSWESPVEFHFGREAEGTYGLSLATATADEAVKVTLMIFDASTKFDELALAPLSGDLALEDRDLERTFPQLDVRTLGIGNYQAVQRTTDVFAKAPASLFVYPKLDLDKDIARINTSVTDGAAYPVKNERLLVTGVGTDRVNVIAADGLRYDLKRTHVLLAPDGEAVVLKAPRSLKKDLPFESVLNLAAPKAKKSIYDAYSARRKKHEDCADRVWRPYGKQLDGATWTIRDGSSSVRVESPRAKKIRESGDRAVDSKCGDDSKLRKDKEATRLKLLTEVEKERVKLLASTRK